MTTSAGRRRSSARTSAANRSAGPIIRPSRAWANAASGVRASQSRTTTLWGEVGPLRGGGPDDVLGAGRLDVGGEHAVGHDLARRGPGARARG